MYINSNKIIKDTNNISDNISNIKKVDYKINLKENFKSFHIKELEFTNFIKNKKTINNKNILKLFDIDITELLEIERVENKGITNNKKGRRAKIILNMTSNINRTYKLNSYNLYKISLGKKERAYFYVKENEITLLLLDAYHLLIPSNNKDYKKEYLYNKNNNCCISKLRK